MTFAVVVYVIARRHRLRADAERPLITTIEDVYFVAHDY